MNESSRLKSAKGKNRALAKVKYLIARKIHEAPKPERGNTGESRVAKRNIAVAARSLADNCFYFGLAAAAEKRSSNLNVQFPWGSENISRDDIRPLGGSVPCRKLNFGDKVLVDITPDGKITDKKHYMEGKVAVEPPHYRDSFGFYNILLENGKMVQKRRKQLVYLERAKFELPKSPSPPPKPKEIEDRATQTYPEPKRQDSSQQTDTPKVQRLREGQEVIARFPDDGWFYFGIVNSKFKEQIDSYDIVDSTGHEECIRNDDIFVPNECTVALEVSDWVVAPHPNYVHSYAPGKIVSLFPEHIEVEFYDNIKSKICKCGVVKISKKKYDKSVKYIKQCEASILDLEAIVLDEREQGFKLKMVHSRIDSHEFVVCEKSSSTVTTQKAAHIFPLKPEFKIKKKQKLDYVLAPSDESCELYLPAKVSKGSRTGNGSTRTVTFHFYNGLKSSADTDKCFYLSQTYYDFAVKTLSPSLLK